MAAVNLSRETCSICVESYLDSRGHIPKVLGCGHTFCEGCLESLRSMGRRDCPTCRRENFPPAGTEFTTNFALYEGLPQQVKESEQALQEGAAGQPASAHMALLIKGEALFAAGNTEEGERVFNELIGQTSERDFYNQRARAQLGWIYADRLEHRERVVQMASFLQHSEFQDVQIIARLVLARVYLSRQDYENAWKTLWCLETYDARGVLPQSAYKDYIPLWLEYARGKGDTAAKFHVLSNGLDKKNVLPEYQEDAVAFCEFCSGAKAAEVNPFLRKLKDGRHIQPGIQCRAILQLARNLSLHEYNVPSPNPFYYTGYTLHEERWMGVVRLLRSLLDVTDPVIRRATHKELAAIYEKRGEFSFAVGVLHVLVQDLSDPTTPEGIDAQLELARLYRKIGGDSLPLRDRVVEQILQNPAATEEQKTRAKKLARHEAFDSCSIQ